MEALPEEDSWSVTANSRRNESHDYPHGIMAEAQKQNWALIALDSPIDTTTPIGEAVATIIATFAQLERAMIAERTRDALAEKKAQGVRLGRPKSLPDDLVARIVTEKNVGRTMRQIASSLNDDGVPTAHGGKEWSASSVSAVLKSATRRA